MTAIDQTQTLPATIQVRAKTVYGVTLWYPASAGADLLCQLVGTRTLTPRSLSIAKAMGINVEIVHAQTAAPF